MCEMIERTCPVCFINYSIPLALFNSASGEWHCPNGHSLVRSNKKNEVSELKEKIRNLDNQVSIWKRSAENALREVRELKEKMAVKVAISTEVKRLKKKINAYKSTIKRMRK